jgi:uncharacterized protein YwgA
MDSLQRASLVLALNEKLRHDGSWAGETHMQKATYFLQHLMNVPLGFEFVLYKHGPFSFDLRDELTAMRAQGFLRLEPQDPYGPRLVSGDKSQLLQKSFRESVDQYSLAIQFVSEKLASKNVSGLERVATALYVTLDNVTDTDGRASRIVQLKPHISLDDARAAVAEVDQIINQAIKN